MLTCLLNIGALTFRYPDISPEDIQKICPACRGNCNCKVCLRGDNLIKVSGDNLIILFQKFMRCELCLDVLVGKNKGDSCSRQIAISPLSAIFSASCC